MGAAAHPFLKLSDCNTKRPHPAPSIRVVAPLRARDMAPSEPFAKALAATPRHEPVTGSNLCFVTVFAEAAQQAVPRDHTP
jgi:hypothetical protein